MIAAAVSGQVMPHDVLSTELQAVIQEIDPNLHLYLSLSAPPSANAACLTALETLPPRRLRGIRDETPGCTLGLAAMERFQGTRFEVYTADETALVNLIDHGGAGLISPGANLLGGVAAQLIRPGKRSAGIAHATKVVSTLLHKQPAVSSIKALLARHTGLPQWDRVRLPLRPLGSAERDILFRSFDASGIKLRSTVQTPPLPPTPTKSPLQQVPERP
jgi:4-hydroxy-tetrahydrodipicolinate synthase